jgi:hypothetical protein
LATAEGFDHGSSPKKQCWLQPKKIGDPNDGGLTPISSPIEHIADRALRNFQFLCQGTDGQSPFIQQVTDYFPRGNASVIQPKIRRSFVLSDQRYERGLAIPNDRPAISDQAA